MKKSSVLFFFSISYMIIFSILTINTLLNVKETINIVPDDNYNDKIQNLKIKIEEITDLKCQNSLYDLLNVSENTNFNGNVRLRKIYETIKENEFLTTSYIKVKGNCNLDNELVSKINPYIVSSSLSYENIIQKYLFQYELSLNDKYERFIDETTSINTQLRMTKLQELDIIAQLVEIEVQNER